MGVKGFQSFLKSNEKYVGQGRLLHDTKLVIDANNLLCHLFADMASNRRTEHYRFDVYGGDLVAYSEFVKLFFANLKQCNITPILVFDGSSVGSDDLKDFVASKEKTVLSRGFERFQAAQRQQEFPNDGTIQLPQTVNIVFRSIASDLELKRIQAVYEADAHIARIANDLNCPVLTNDSDFIIFNLKQGFIMLDLFDWRTPHPDGSGKRCIDCCLFNHTRLTKTLPGLRAETMPLLSVLLGNDYVEAGTFDRVIESICSGHYNGPLEARSFSHRRIANLLSWMRNRSLDDCIEYILQRVPNYSQEKLNRCFRVLLRNYVIEKVDNFESELLKIYKPRAEEDPNKMPHNYLRRLMEREDLGSICLDIVFHHTHYNYQVMGDHRLPSPSFVKFRPLSLATCLLRPSSYSNLTTYKRKLLAQSDSFHIYDRLNQEYTEIVIRPLEKLENFGSLEHIDCHTMISLDPALKKTLLMSTFRFNSDEFTLMNETLSLVFKGPHLEQACLCFLLEKYVCLETKLLPKSQFIQALLLTLFYYAALAGNVNLNSINESAYGNLLLRLRPHSKMVNGKEYSNDPSLYKRIVHFISMLQSAYKSYCLINSLLDHPFVAPRLELFFNCTLIYRMTKLLRTKELMIEDLCKDLKVLCEVCDSVGVQTHCEI